MLDVIPKNLFLKIYVEKKRLKGGPDIEMINISFLFKLT